MRKRVILLAVVCLIMACQVVPTPPSLTATLPLRKTPLTETLPALITASSTPVVTATSQGWGTLSPLPGELAIFPPGSSSFAGLVLPSWQTADKVVDTPALPIALDQVANLAVTAGLNNSQRTYLSENGFVVIHSQEAQFSVIRQRVADRFGQPYYLTTDAAYHALDLAVDELRAALEREELRPRLINLTSALLDEVWSYLPLVQDIALRKEILIASEYLGVGLKLLDSDVILQPELQSEVNAQIAQIEAAEGIASSSLIPDYVDNFAAYIPDGHYVGDVVLESYFRAMTWFSRVQFKLDYYSPDKEPSRLPMIVTLALRRVGEETVQDWIILNDALAFLNGQSEPLTPREYAGLMDQVYGRNQTALSLSDVPLWQTLQAMGLEIPLDHFSQTLANTLGETQVERSWRFLGANFKLDEQILQALVYTRVGKEEMPRELPSGLDIMAALGSPDALLALEQAGAKEYLNYSEQMNKLRDAVSAQTHQQWLEAIPGVWLYAAIQQFTPKTTTYPPYMRTDGWNYKALNSALGGWVELRHDALQIVQEINSGITSDLPASGPPPGYVQPDPLFFYHLAYLANTLADGLTVRGLVGMNSSSPFGLANLIREVLDLGDRMQRLGDIAGKELAGEPLSASDYELINAPLGPAEARAARSQSATQQGEVAAYDLPAVPVVNTVTGSGENILQVGIGPVDRIYLVVPIGNDLFIAQGGVYSYYEFIQPFEDQLDDDGWRWMLSASPPSSPAWVTFVPPGGAVVDVLAFRIGDVYQITPAGARLSLREAPSRRAALISQLQAGEYVVITEGPVQEEGLTWWKFKTGLSGDKPQEGWAVENPAWYERAWKR